VVLGEFLAVVRYVRGIVIDNTHWSYYQTKTLAVIPYMPGTPVYRDGMLPMLYFKLKEEGKIADCFCGEEKNLDSFIAHFDSLKTLQVLAELEGENIIPVGFSWVSMPRGQDGARACQCGEAFFSGSSKRSSARSLAKMAVAYAFNALRIDILHGLQVVTNIAARNFSLRIGFKECAVVPSWHYIDGELVDARIMILRKEDYMPKFDIRIAEQKSL